MLSDYEMYYQYLDEQYEDDTAEREAWEDDRAAAEREEAFLDERVE